MKRHLGSFAAVSSHAAVILLSDNFDSVTSFTADPNADQSGVLAASTYTVGDLDNETGGLASRGSGVLDLGTNGTLSDRSAKVRTNADYITFANTHDTPIQFSFDYDATGSAWVGFMVGTKDAWMDSDGTRTEFSALFRNDGTGKYWDNGASQGAFTPFTYPQTIKVELRNTAGTGSAFNGSGSVGEFWAGSTSLGIVTLDQLSATNGQSWFASYQDPVDTTVGHVDNFTITATIPEPSSLGLIGFCGVLAFLVRRFRA